MNNLRLPAEWERHDYILMAWPHKDTDWAPILDEAVACYVNIVETISPYEPIIMLTPDPEVTRRYLGHIPADRLKIVACPTNDTWTRDYGPITVEEDMKRKYLLDFKFNGWGLKFAADKDNLVNTELLDSYFYNPDCYWNYLSFVLEGGSIESNGVSTILSTSHCLLSLNRNGGMSTEVLEDYICHITGADELIMLDFGGISGDDTDSHIDTLARFVDAHMIVYVGAPDDPADPDYEGLKKMEKQLEGIKLRNIGKPELVHLPYAGPVYGDDGERLPATYANFLITPKAIFMPIYGLPTDEEALRIMRGIYDCDVIGVDCLTLIKQHGSLHCATMQLFKETLNNED